MLRNDSYNWFARKLTLENISKILETLASIVGKSTFTLIDREHKIIFPKESLPIENQLLDIEPIIDQAKHYKEIFFNADKDFVIYPIWLREPPINIEPVDTEKGDALAPFKDDYFIGIIYISPVKKDNYNTIYQLMNLVNVFIRQLSERNYETADTVKNFVDIQNSLKRLYESIEIIGMQQKITDISDNLLRVINEKLEPEYSCFLLFDEDTKKLNVVDMMPQNDEIILSFDQDSNGIIQKIFKKGSSDIIYTEDEKRLQSLGESVGKMIAVPFPQKGTPPTGINPIGMVCVINSEEGKDFYAADEKFIATISVPAAIAINNIKLNEEMKQNAWKDISFRAGHRIGNILFGIAGEIDWLKDVFAEKPLQENELKSAIQGLEDSLDDANQIVKEMKGYMKPDELQLERVQINSVLKNTISIIENAAKPHKIKSNFNSELTEIEVDISKIKQVFTELIENACRSLDEEGRITLTTDIANEKDKRLTGIFDKEKYISIKIADTGNGVPKENKTKIFLPAFSTRGEGTGMGLAIVRQNVELHEGRIIEIGELQKGAEFLIMLPID